jgi:hypothetical protein
MGVHISKGKLVIHFVTSVVVLFLTTLVIVRSIDLDTWSDEQIKMLVKWGNKRANL